jgi:hypothetical protein
MSTLVVCIAEDRRGELHMQFCRQREYCRRYAGLFRAAHASSIRTNVRHSKHLAKLDESDGRAGLRSKEQNAAAMGRHKHEEVVL